MNAATTTTTQRDTLGVLQKLVDQVEAGFFDHISVDHPNSAVIEARQHLAIAQASALHQVASQQLQPIAVGAPVGSAVGGDATVAVEIYALGRGISLARQGHDLPLSERAFELEAHGQRFVIDPLACGHAHGFVAPIKGHVLAVWQQIKAVDQEVMAEAESGRGHERTPLKTAILSLPQGMGKSTIAQALAVALGCGHIVDEWSPVHVVLPGALHLTSSEVWA